MLTGPAPRIRRHRIDGVPYLPTKHVGGEITPSVIVLHDTAGPIRPGSSRDFLRSNPRKVSAHVVLERDGSAAQLAPLNRKANHAGESRYHGRRWANGFAIGIEIVNPGRMIRTPRGDVRAWWGQEFSVEELGAVEMTTREHGHGWWAPHTAEQIDQVVRLCMAMVDRYEIEDIVPHWYVSPGRKIDTNPLLPLDEIKAVVLGRDDDVGGQAEVGSKAVQGEAYVRVDVPGGDTLNMRRWPSFNPNVLAAIPDGVVVPVVRRGTFDGRAWSLVVYGGVEGWVVDRYTEEARR